MGELFLAPYVRSVWRRLADRLGATGRLALFGAGAHTRWLLSVTADLPPLRIPCLLDDNPAEDSLGDIPIRRPADIDVDSFDVILISSDRWEAELAARVKELWGGRYEVVRLYEDVPRGPYDKSDDRTEALAQLQRRSALGPDEPCQVVIVSDQPGPREAKIGYALRHIGWQPILLHRKQPSFDATRSFDAVRAYRHEWEALRIACDYSPIAYHLMVYGDYSLAELFLQHRPGLIVVDSYDLIAGMLSEEFLAGHPEFATQIECERFCLEQADGLCCRSREAQFLEEVRGYRYNRRLLLPDGCWNERAAERPSYSNDELHTVYAGHMPLSTGRCAGVTSHGCKLWVARTLADQGIHFHLYPWCDLRGQSFEEVFREYRKLERSTPYFHLHETVPPERLISELARYDLAIFVYNEFVGPGTPQSGSAVNANYTPDKFRVGAANKLFDFIDAGLPVVHTAAPGSFLSSLLDRHGIRIEVRDVEPAGWGSLLRTLDLPDLKARVRRAREDYDIRRHIHELTEFYQELRADGPAETTGVSKNEEVCTYAHS